MHSTNYAHVCTVHFTSLMPDEAGRLKAKEKHLCAFTKSFSVVEILSANMLLLKHLEICQFQRTVHIGRRYLMNHTCFVHSLYVPTDLPGNIFKCTEEVMSSVEFSGYSNQVSTFSY